MMQQQQSSVAGRSAVTIQVGTSSNAASTGSTGAGRASGGTRQPAASAAVAADAGRHDNASQQPAGDTRSAVNIRPTSHVSVLQNKRNYVSLVGVVLFVQNYNNYK